MTNKYIQTTKILIIVTVIIALLIFLSPNKNKDADDSFIIGFSGPLVGPVAWLGELYLEGLVAAEKEINSEGGINGRPIKLLVENNEFTGQGGINTFNALKNKGSQIIISLGTVPSVPMSPLSKESGIPLLTVANFVDLTEDNPFAIHMSILPEIDVETTIADMEKNNVKKIGVLYLNNEYGVATLEEFKERIKNSNITIVNEEAFFPETPDFSTSILKIATSDIDAIYLIDLSFIRPMTHLRQNLTGKNKGIDIYLPASAYSSDNIVKNSKLFEGVRVTVPLVSVNGTNERDEFLKTLSLPMDSTSSLTHQAIGYDNLYAIANILKENQNIESFAEEFSSFGSMQSAIGKYNLNSRYIGIPLVPAVFTKGELYLIE